ncbi:MAG: NADP-dependent isocitrate dehydrogenase, partial [Acidimicrobiia bacterium]|nr:NADP-dependent isocitrate dehydrogenase [Acidimicrobiia bacterium]
MSSPTILYTHTDEAPALATRSLLPIIRAYAAAAGIDVETRDISLAGRILAAVSDWLPAEQRVPDDLAELGKLALTPEANIIKLPNISASIPQMRAAIAELQAAGYAVPDYPDEPTNDEERAVKAAYDKVKGSAVNPVLREGNSDRRAPKAVKNYARSHPHSMGAWSADSKTHVATMGEGDFRSNEKSVTMTGDDVLRIELVAGDGTVDVLHQGVAVEAGEVVDGTFLSVRALKAFLAEQVVDAKALGVLFSLHLKATMMKVSDPIIFGHGVRAFFADVFDRFGDALAAAGANPNDGWGDVLA